MNLIREKKVTNRKIILTGGSLMALGCAAPDNGYTMGGFNTYIDDVAEYTEVTPPTNKANPKVGNTNFLTANLSVDLNQVLHWPINMPQTSLSLYGDNLLDEDMHDPITAGAVINTLPEHSGRGVYGRLSMKF